MKRITLLLFLTIITLFNACKSDEPVVANFEFTLSDEGKITFNNISSNANSYEWDFGNGGKSTEMNPSTQYLKNGDYSVVLIAKGSKTQDTKIQKVSVTNAAKSIVKFSTKNTGNGNVEFINETLNADSYKWTFGNGLTSNEKNPKTKYETNGSYEVKLEATNVNGTNELKQTITILDAPKPISDFSFSVSSYIVTFTNQTQNGDSYLWTFGDGTTSTEKSPTKSYTANGNFNVTLTSKNKNGEHTISKVITTKDYIAPDKGLVIFWKSFSGNVTVTVNGVTQGTITDLRNFNDGSFPDCNTTGFVTVNLTPGTYNFSALSQSGQKWASTITVVGGQCRAMRLAN